MLLEDSLEFLDLLKKRLEKLHTLRQEKQVREYELLTIAGKQIEVANATDIVTGIDKMVSNQEKQQIKQLYRTFIQKIIFMLSCT